MFALSGWSGGLADRYGARLPLVAGPAIAAAGFALMALPGTGGSYWTTFFPGVTVLGFGMAICVAPLTTTVMNALGADLAGAASGVNNAVSRIAGLLAVALFGLVMNHFFEATLQPHLDSLALPADALHALATERAKLGAMQVPASLDAGVRSSLRAAIAESFVAGFRWVMALSALMALASAAIAWLTIAAGRPPRPRPSAT